jgi:nucleotide-binding universal stress UspA family protein
MKILIGYDGSEHSDAAIDDLKRAGMPRDSEVLIASVADLLIGGPELSEVIGRAITSRRNASGQKRRKRTPNASPKKRKKRVRKLFPEWNVRAEVMIGTPAWVLIDIVNKWNADLVVVGSQGRSALKRFFLGSVSKRVATDASCSVRVARAATKRRAEARRIMIGVDGSPAAEQAIHSVGQRVWDSGTEIKLIAVDDGTPPTAGVSTFLPQAAEMINNYLQNRESRVRSMLEWAASELDQMGLKASVSMKKGFASKVLLAEARKWNADSIFVGTRDFSSAFERFRLGGVSTAVVTKADCSVEIVRPSNESQK